MKLLLLTVAPLLLGSCKEHATPLEAANQELLRENAALQAKVEKLEKENAELTKKHRAASQLVSQFIDEKHAAERQLEGMGVKATTK